MSVGPILFEPILIPKVWGGNRLARFGKAVGREPIGESWELADLASTSASGAGGGAQRTRIRSGPLAGLTFGEALARWGDRLRPRSMLTREGAFPLLIKFLDARENLSVQVHPSPAYARAHPGAHLKTECWCVLDAAPGSVIYKGVRPGVTRRTFEAALRRGDGSGVVELLHAEPARAGECHNLPSGTCHALGAGVLVAEVQTPSDTTYRVYDWGRVGRALHVDEALECIEFGPAPDAVRLEGGGRLATEFFVVEGREVAGAGLAMMERPAAAWIVLAGAGALRERASGEEIPLRAGDTGLTPWKPDGEWWFRGAMTLLVATSPARAD